MKLADIIIVEDNPAIREALAEYLLDEGFAVRTASDGAALDLLLQARTADALILDLNLPHENGYAIAQRVRQSFPAIGILILSARVKSDPSDPQAAIADLQMAKPAEPRALAQAVRQVYALAMARRG
jgi:DNA-binding response OmpR family regulator